MKIIDSIARKLGYFKPTVPEMRRRGYSGADLSRITADWLAASTSGNVEIRGAIKLLRDRSRDMERSEDYARRYFALEANNVIGADGIKLQVKALAAGGKVDKAASKAVEDGWYKWGRKEFCTVTKRMTWNQATRLSLRSASRDGGVLVRKVPNFSNAFSYAIQPLEIDHLAIDMQRSRSQAGNEIILGVELDRWAAPVAYHIYPQHPGETQGVTTGNKPVRVPANEVLHIMNPDRLSQAVGVPSMASSLLRMKMLGAYEEAELIAARVAACKGYGIEQIAPDGYTGPADANGNIVAPVEPGMGLLLNPGEKYFNIDPQHPVEAYPAFTKSIVRGIASGLGVSYNSLANDLDSVNYSSIRAGLLEEREEWKAKQQWLIEELCLPIFEDWLGWSLTTGAIEGLSMADYERVNQPKWTPRRWPWVDPLKDVEATIKAIAARLQTREQALAEQGKDREEVDAEFALDPVTADLDSELAYIPETAKVDAQPEEVPITNGKANGNGRIALH